jgi:hypothetical protein
MKKNGSFMTFKTSPVGKSANLPSRAAAAARFSSIQPDAKAEDSTNELLHISSG